MEGVAQVECFAKWVMSTRAEVYVHAQGSLVAIHNPACLFLISVIAQQYSTATFFSLRFHSHKDNLYTHSKQWQSSNLYPF
jgi:hypothetical protein